MAATLKASAWNVKLILAVLVAMACGMIVASPLRASATAGFGLTDDEKTALLTKHNDARAHYNTPALKWDDNLAALAVDWANQLAAGNGNLSHRPNNRYGENIFASGPPGSSSADSAVDDWMGEVSNYNLKDNTCSATCGHFTQVVWSTTTRVGCGKASGAGWDFVVCNYDPAGNIVGVSPGISVTPDAVATTGATTNTGTTTNAPTTPATPETTTPAITTTTPATTVAAGPTELSAGSCSTPVKSIDATQTATVVFENKGTGMMSGYWVDYSGNPQPWFTLAVGEKLSQDTYVTHPWAIANAAGACVGVFLPVAGASHATLK